MCHLVCDRGLYTVELTDAPLTQEQWLWRYEVDTDIVNES